MPNRWRIAAFIVFFVPVWIVCCVIVGQYYVHADESGSKGTNEEEREFDLKVADLIAQTLMAGGTLAILCYTIKAVRTANKTAEDSMKASRAALEATRESNRITSLNVDTYIKAERGYLMYTECSGNPDRTKFSATFTNMGRSPVIVLHTLYDFNSTPIKSRKIPKVYFGSKGRSNYPVGPGQKFVVGSAGQDPSSLKDAPEHIPPDIAAKVLMGDALVVDYGIIFDTNFAGKFLYAIKLVVHTREDGEFGTHIQIVSETPLKERYWEEFPKGIIAKPYGVDF